MLIGLFKVIAWFQNSSYYSRVFWLSLYDQRKTNQACKTKKNALLTIIIFCLGQPAAEEDVSSDSTYFQPGGGIYLKKIKYTDPGLVTSCLMMEKCSTRSCFLSDCILHCIKFANVLADEFMSNCVLMLS